MILHDALSSLMLSFLMSIFCDVRGFVGESSG